MPLQRIQRPLRSPARLLALLLVGFLGQACVYPPVVAGPSLTREAVSEGVLRIAAPASVALDASRAAHGFTVDAGPGCAVVLHLSSADHSVVSLTDARWDPLGELLSAGMSSLAVDYSGVGLSGGEHLPSRLVSDARAMYEHAVKLVGGDESRVVLRASSIGTVLAAELLRTGATPGAVIAFAPVEAGSLARRYSAQFWWCFAYWPAAPFLKRIARADTFAELEKAPCPVVIYTSPFDCFVSHAEFDAMVAAAASLERLVCVERINAFTEAAVHPGFEIHSAIVHLSAAVQPEELEIYRARFGANGPVDLERHDGAWWTRDDGGFRPE